MNTLTILVRPAEKYIRNVTYVYIGLDEVTQEAHTNIEIVRCCAGSVINSTTEMNLGT